MAAAPGPLLWLLALGALGGDPGLQDSGAGRRFSRLKLCADDECSMLMYRGEALGDFTGPDCRFVNFKKGDPVYVYYKLAGGSPEVWAGSVGRLFGYFPKDLIKVHHEYTKNELQVPAEETDFVCFDGGRDDFDNYNVEDLLGFLDLYDSAGEESEKTVEAAPQHGERPPEEPKERGPDAGPADADSAERGGAWSGSTEHLQDQILAQESQPHVNSPTDNAQGEQSSFDSFEEMLQEKLKVLESENKTGNSSQASREQETLDAYKLLKTEMTLDLKTKFGSTADALVSDDETTRLVTSLEDEFEEELDPEYYAVENEDKENPDDLEELPLLTFMGTDDMKTPAMSGLEKYSTDKEPNSSEEERVEVTLPPGLKNDGKNILTDAEATFFSFVTGGEEKTGRVDVESSSSEEEKDEDAFVPDSKQKKPQSATDDVGPEKADGGLFIEVSKANDEKFSELDTELYREGEGRGVQEAKRDLAQEESELEGVKAEKTTTYASQSNGFSSAPAAGNGKGILKSAFEHRENELRETVIHVSKEALHEEEPRGEILEGGSKSESESTAVGHRMAEEESGWESTDVVPRLGGDGHNASKGRLEEVDGSLSGPGVHLSSPEQRHEELKEELVVNTQNQPTFSSPEEINLSRGLEEKMPTLERNISWQQERDMTAATGKQGSVEAGLSEQEGKEDTADAELAPHEATQRTQQADSTAVPASQTETPEAGEDNYPPEELLEDENAIGAKRSEEKHPAIQDRRPGVNPHVSESVIVGSPGSETKGNNQETDLILEPASHSAAPATGEDRPTREPGSLAEGEGGSAPADGRAREPPEVRASPDEDKAWPSAFREVFQSKDPAGLKRDHVEHQVRASGPVEKPGGEEMAEKDPEDAEKFLDPESWGPASEALEDELLHPGPPEPELRYRREDTPIISSFFKEEPPLLRFLKYFDGHKLEAMLQELSSQLQSAQRESLPYSVEKGLDKVFRASEAQILSLAERMLDARVTRNRDLGGKSNIFEEAAALDDIQDLIYFVRYKHSTVEEAAPLVTAPPLEEGWAARTEEVQPPQEDSFSQENPDLTTQLPEEPVLWDQPKPEDEEASGVAPKPDTENDVDPGLLTTEYTPVDAADAAKQPETEAEELARVTALENTIHLIYSLMYYLTKTLVATLPDDVQPGPDFYGLPWKPVVLTAFLGIVSFAVFFWKKILIVKNRVYQVTEQQISEKLKSILKENAELVQKLSSYEEKIEDSKKHIQETKKKNMILSDEASKYKDKIKTLEEMNEILGDKAKSLCVMLESEREQNIRNENLMRENKKSIEKLKDVISMNVSELSEVQIALNEAKLSEEKVKSECHRVHEENARLKKKKEQLQQKIEDWSKSHAELSEKIKSFEKSQKDLEVALTHKDDNINALTNCITQLNQLECESESEPQKEGGDESDELDSGEVGGDRSERMKNQIEQMMDVARKQTAVSLVEEDLKLLQLKLRASISTKSNLEDQIKKLEDDCRSLQSTKGVLEDECNTLRQKVEILNELYQQKEMALQKKLSQEEYVRQEREQQLSSADEKAVLAAEEVKVYKQRIEEIEEELQKTERSYKSQIAALEKKAHDNWLKARAAERAIAEERKEAANLRHKLLEMTQKMAMRKDEPVIIKPMPGRPNPQNPPRRGPLSQNGSFGPSPVSGGECSPPLMAEPPGRPLSATLSRRDVPRSDFGPVDGPLPRPRWSSEASGKPSGSDPGSGPAPVVDSSPRSSSPAKMMDEGKVNMATSGPPPFPRVPLMGPPMGGPFPPPPMGGPVPPPLRYGPPPQLCGPFRPRPFPPPLVPGMRPPLDLWEYAPGAPPGKRDLPLDPRGFLPGHAPFRPVGPLGPREYFMPGPRLPPPAHGPQDYPPPSAAGDPLSAGPRDEPSPASQNSGQDCSQALKQSP